MSVGRKLVPGSKTGRGGLTMEVIRVSVRSPSVHPALEMRVLSSSLLPSGLGLLLLDGALPGLERVDGRVVRGGETEPVVVVVVLVLCVLDKVPTLNKVLRQVHDGRSDDRHRRVVPGHSRNSRLVHSVRDKVIHVLEVEHSSTGE